MAVKLHSYVTFWVYWRDGPVLIAMLRNLRLSGEQGVNMFQEGAIS
jgi:hypothetical protein